MRAKRKLQSLASVYKLLLSHFGPQPGWWPASTPFEVAVGAVLTQNTNWRNVEKAIINLKQAKLLTPANLARAPIPALEQLVRPSGFYRQKARRIRLLAHEYQQLDARTPLPALREQLLAVNGVGNETADSILLYAFNMPSFVIDAYTKRILARHGVELERYEHYRSLFESSLPRSAPLYQEYHALIVELAKHICTKARPRCTACPLKGVRISPSSKPAP